MSEQEKFDDLLRSKLSERDFPFDEHNWDKAELKIERAENQRKFRRIGIIFISGVAIGVLIMLPFIMNKNSGVTQQIASANNTGANQVIATQSSTNTNSPSTNSPTTVTSHPISSGSDNSGSQSIASGNSTQPSGNNSTVVANNNPATLPTPIATTVTKQKTNTASSTPEQYSYVRPAKEKHSHKSANSTSPVQNVATTSPTVASTNNTNSGNTPASNQQEITNTGTNNITVNSTNVNKSAASNLDLTQTNNSTASSPAVNNNNASTTKTTIKDSAATASITSPDTTANSPDGFINPPPQPKKQSSSLTTFSIDAGGGYSLGWMKDGATQGNGLSPVFGISTTHYFSGTWSAYLGVQFNMLNNVNILYSNNANQYSFGLNTNVNSVTLKTLYYVAVPVRIQYCFGFNNLISVGANALYLVNTSSSVVTYNQDYFGVSGYTSANKPGYMDGLNTIDVQAAIAYKRKIYNRLTAGLEFYYGLLNIEDNSFFGDNTFARNSGLKLIFSYDIIK